jgi:GNAT superfamily N-acetyltransferase
MPPDDEYEISAYRGRLDVDAIHRFLSTQAYWSPGVAREVVERSIEHSFPFGVYRGDEQAGFARVVTDRATFAWLADVYIEPAHRGRGLGKRLVGAVLAHPELAGMRRWMLGTADAHGLYRRFGFVEIEDSGRFMVVEGEAAARLCSGD